MSLVFVTGNAGKLREISAVMSHCKNCQFTSENLDLPELQGSSTLKIARQKALVAYQRLQKPVLIEDTSLCFNALGGLPGPYIKWFLQKIGPQGLPRMLFGFDDKTAYASCIFILCVNANKIYSFEGRCCGNIVEPRGEMGFGWDSIFQPNEPGIFDYEKRTYAQMSQEEKNSISHRGRALIKLQEFLDSQEFADIFAEKTPRGE